MENIGRISALLQNNIKIVPRRAVFYGPSNGALRALFRSGVHPCPVGRWLQSLAFTPLLTFHTSTHWTLVGSGWKKNYIGLYRGSWVKAGPFWPLLQVDSGMKCTFRCTRYRPCESDFTCHTISPSFVIFCDINLVRFLGTITKVHIFDRQIHHCLEKILSPK